MNTLKPDFWTNAANIAERTDLRVTLISLPSPARTKPTTAAGLMVGDRVRWLGQGSEQERAWTQMLRLHRGDMPGYFIASDGLLCCWNADSAHLWDWQAAPEPETPAALPVTLTLGVGVGKDSCDAAEYLARRAISDLVSRDMRAPAADFTSEDIAPPAYLGSDEQREGYIHDKTQALDASRPRLQRGAAELGLFQTDTDMMARFTALVGGPVETPRRKR